MVPQFPPRSERVNGRILQGKNRKTIRWESEVRTASFDGVPERLTAEQELGWLSAWRGPWTANGPDRLRPVHKVTNTSSPGPISATLGLYIHWTPEILSRSWPDIGCGRERHRSPPTDLQVTPTSTIHNQLSSLNSQPARAPQPCIHRKISLLPNDHQPGLLVYPLRPARRTPPPPANEYGQFTTM